MHSDWKNSYIKSYQWYPAPITDFDVRVYPLRTCSIHLPTYIYIYPHRGTIFFSVKESHPYVLFCNLIQFSNMRCLRELPTSIHSELPYFNCFTLFCNMNIPGLFSSSPTDWRLAYFPFFPIINNPAMNIPVSLWTSLYLYARVQTFPVKNTCKWNRYMLCVHP